MCVTIILCTKINKKTIDFHMVGNSRKTFRLSFVRLMNFNEQMTFLFGINQIYHKIEPNQAKRIVDDVLDVWWHAFLYACMSMLRTIIYCRRLDKIIFKPRRQPNIQVAVSVFIRQTKNFHSNPLIWFICFSWDWIYSSFCLDISSFPLLSSLACNLFELIWIININDKNGSWRWLRFPCLFLIHSFASVCLWFGSIFFLF